ncbi:coiled-coil domain-containing protein 201 [Hipposideros larvatus]
MITSKHPGPAYVCRQMVSPWQVTGCAPGRPPPSEASLVLHVVEDLWVQMSQVAPEDLSFDVVLALAQGGMEAGSLSGTVAPGKTVALRTLRCSPSGGAEDAQVQGAPPPAFCACAAHRVAAPAHLTPPAVRPPPRYFRALPPPEVSVPAGSGMEPGAQVPSFSSSEDEGPPSVPRWPSSGLVPKHSTPKEGPLPWRRRPLGHVPHRWGGGPAEGSPLPSRSSRVLSSSLRKRRLSTIWASEESSGQLGPDSDPQAPEEGPPVLVSATWRQQQRQEASPGSWPGSRGLPGIQNTAGRRPRKRKDLAVVMERVRQWEARQLQSIEEATQHELTVQDA